VFEKLEQEDKVLQQLALSLLAEAFFLCSWRDSCLPFGVIAVLLVLVSGSHVNSCAIKVVL